MAKKRRKRKVTNGNQAEIKKRGHNAIPIHRAKYEGGKNISYITLSA